MTNSTKIMSLEKAIEHGRCWLAAGWRWHRGQIALAKDFDGNWKPFLVLGVNRHGQPDLACAPTREHAVPDLRDNGTLAHALGQVREAWGAPVSTECDGYEQWSCRTRSGHLPMSRIWHPSEPEALLAAREAAP